MSFKKKITKSSYTMLLACVIISVVTLISVSFICAVIANLSDDPTSLVGMLTLISILCSAAVSGMLITRLFEGEGVRLASLTALMIALIMMLIGLISNHGTLPTSGIMNYICYLLTAVFFAVVGRRRRGVKKHRSHK